MFENDDPALVIPKIGDHIAAIATSPTSKHTYHITRQHVREILEWAEKDGIQATALGTRQIEAAPIEAGS